MADPKSTYERALAEHRARLAVLESRSRTLATLRLVAALGAIGLIGAIVWAPLPHETYAGVLALALLFVGLVVAHARVHRNLEDTAAAIAFHERALARLADTWMGPVAPGSRGAPEGHAYAGDLDLFGKASLFQLLDATRTRFGADALSRWLLGPADAGEIALRQDAVRELAKDERFREHLAVLGTRTAAATEIDAFFKWAESTEPPVVTGALRVAGWVLPPLTIGALVVGNVVGWPTAMCVAPYFLSFILSLALRGRLGPTLAAASSRESSVGSYAPLFELLEGRKVESVRLAALQKTLASGETSAARATKALATLCSYLDAQGNEVFRLFFAPVLLLEVNGVAALERWRARYGKTMRGSFDALGQVEALSSLANLAFEHPDYAWPTLTEAGELHAEALGHPLLASTKRVCNDVAFDGPGQALVVTGSNMAGKSTLMRALGINVVLALAGAPVCAKKLTLGPLRLATSMRVEDSLAEGTSHFYAELKRLKVVVDAAKAGPALFFLLDEILHGTNSRERLLGARAVLRDLVAHGALGAVSTHDLGLADLETELPEKVRNVHFEEQVSGDAMTFDYRLRPGVVQSSNALRLMRALGLPVE